MGESKITFADMVTKMIADGQLSAAEEMVIKKMIEEKQKKAGGQKGRCLADVVGAEIMEKLDEEDVKMNSLYQSVYRKCFEENRVGRKDSFKLSEAMIKKYQKDVTELYGLDEKEIAIFFEMLQAGLRILEEDGILDFAPDKNTFCRFKRQERKVSYISNPYSSGETGRIMEWTECHPTDSRGMALSLWFTGGIALTEIVNLTKKDCWGNVRTADSIMEFKEGLFNSSTRSGIVRKSLDLHPREVRHVFVIPRQDGSGWKRLTEKGLQRKLAYICQEIGITYKKIEKNEAIKLG